MAGLRRDGPGRIPAAPGRGSSDAGGRFLGFDIAPVDIEGRYAVVVTRRTEADPAWSRVVRALVAKYDATVILCEDGFSGWVEPLRAVFPKYACFVARPGELRLAVLLTVARDTRRLDDDPYTDVVWAILTGNRAEDAARIVATNEPLVIRKGLAGDRMDLTPFDEGMWFYEGNDARAEQKRADGRVVSLECPMDNAHNLVRLLNEYHPDYVQTSGHANERQWNVGYGCDRGILMGRNGALWGVNLLGQKKAVRSPNPKVYLAYRNCLVGLIRGHESYALAWLGSGGARQLAGYAVATWNGAAGNGMRRMFFGVPGQYSFSEAFYFSQQLLIEALSPQARDCKPTVGQYKEVRVDQITAMLESAGSRNARAETGAVWDRDTFVLYGDPAWDARLQPAETRPEWRIELHDGLCSVFATAERDTEVDRLLLLPRRVQAEAFLKGRERVYLLADNFIGIRSPVPAGSTELVRIRMKGPQRHVAAPRPCDSPRQAATPFSKPGQSVQP